MFSARTPLKLPKYNSNFGVAIIRMGQTRIEQTSESTALALRSRRKFSRPAARVDLSDRMREWRTSVADDWVNHGPGARLVVADTVVHGFGETEGTTKLGQILEVVRIIFRRDLLVREERRRYEDENG